MLVYYLDWKKYIIHTDPLHERWAPDSVKYLVLHRRNNLQRPFFSLSWPSMTGWVLPLRKPTALSGWLHKKHPHWAISPSFVEFNSNTSKNPDCRNSFNNISWSFEIWWNRLAMCKLYAVEIVLYIQLPLNMEKRSSLMSEKLCFHILIYPNNVWDCSHWSLYYLMHLEISPEE